MNAINYQKELDKITARISDEQIRPTILLHSCCAPCSSYCLVYLRQWFDITCFYYNPNITNKDEYDKRVQELHRLCQCLNEDPVKIMRDDKGNYYLDYSNNNLSQPDNGAKYLSSCGKISVIDGKYEPDIFREAVEAGNLQNEPEGGKRCDMCFGLRLKEAVKVALEGEYDYVSTTLTISPLKDAERLNQIGSRLVEDNNKGLMWLPSDFKKKNGYKFSVELSKRYDLYRQNFCGCEYSKSSN